MAIKKATKKDIVKAVEEATESKVILSVGKCEEYGFLSTINHPRKKILAQGIINGDDESVLIEDFGSIRVSEMKKMISIYNENPGRYLREHSLSVCANCGR